MALTFKDQVRSHSLFGSEAVKTPTQELQAGRTIDLRLAENRLNLSGGTSVYNHPTFAWRMPGKQLQQTTPEVSGTAERWTVSGRCTPAI
jgi:hypothetical protein